MDNFFLLSAAGLVAGAMNALAGGGSFVSLPAFIAVGLPSVQANASSTVALFPGGLTAAWAYRDGLGPIGSVPLRSMTWATVVGGAAGALLLLWTSSTVFNLVLPWLLLLASLALTFGRRCGDWLRTRWVIKPSIVLAVQFGLGVYGGYFGGAVGIMMIAIWGLLDGRDVKGLNGHRMLLVTSANAIAVLTFILAHAVHWPETAIMIVAAMVGGYAGAQIGRLLPSKVTRTGTLFVTGCITLIFFVRAYMPGFMS